MKKPKYNHDVNEIRGLLAKEVANSFGENEYVIYTDEVKQRGMKNQYRITLSGCDDSTIFDLELSEDELSLVEKMAVKSVETSTYGCMPTLQVFKLLNSEQKVGSDTTESK